MEGNGDIEVQVFDKISQRDDFCVKYKQWNDSVGNESLEVEKDLGSSVGVSISLAALREWRGFMH